MPKKPLAFTINGREGYIYNYAKHTHTKINWHDKLPTDFNINNKGEQV